MRHLITAAVLALCAVLTVSAASAHTRLIASVPVAGAIVDVSPSEVRLTFSEPIEPLLSGMEIVGAGGAGIEIANPVVQGAEMAVPLGRPLDPGIYKINWHLVSVDGHRVEGTLTFEVAQ